MKHASITRAAVRDLVDQFYGKVRDDELLGPVFYLALGDDWGPHLDKLTEFWSTIVLGTRSFHGNVYGTHMALADIEPEHFQRWLGLFEETVHQLFEPADADSFLTMAHRVASSLQIGFFGDVLVTQG
ncbi:MAG: group III truncated hemoglobin [Burkholderiaceae bacterium]